MFVSKNDTQLQIALPTNSTTRSQTTSRGQACSLLQQDGGATVLCGQDDDSYSSLSYDTSTSIDLLDDDLDSTTISSDDQHDDKGDGYLLPGKFSSLSNNKNNNNNPKNRPQPLCPADSYKRELLLDNMKHFQDMLLNNTYYFLDDGEEPSDYEDSSEENKEEEEEEEDFWPASI